MSSLVLHHVDVQNLEFPASIKRQAGSDLFTVHPVLSNPPSNPPLRF